MKISFLISYKDKSKKMYNKLKKIYDYVSFEDADVVVVIGGDGFMLHSLRKCIGSNKSIYGINCGTVGFLMNNIYNKNLIECIKSAKQHDITPLEITTRDINGKISTNLAFNEVSIFRKSIQAIQLKISVKNKVRLDKLVCDGALLATPAGSTAYNLSANGTVLPLESKLLVLTPISPFIPRRWRGALLPDTSVIKFEVLNYEQRPAMASADHKEVQNIIEANIKISRENSVTMLTNYDHDLEERIINEQFT